MNIRFFYENLWDQYDLTTVSTEHPNFLGSNTQKRWKTKPWFSNFKIEDDGSRRSRGLFQIDGATDELHFDEGGGALVATMTSGNFTPKSLATEIETQINIAGAHSYTVEYLLTGYYKITDDTGTVNLLLSDTTNAIWDTIGFTTGIDTGLAVSHTADTVRIHTSEYIRVDFGSAVDIYGVFIFGDNLTSSAVARLIRSDDNWANISYNGLTSGSKCWALFSATPWNHRYQGIQIVDQANPQKHIQIGRVWFVGSYFEPRIGFAPKRGRDPKDPSQISASEGGQVSTIQRTKFQTWPYKFDLADPKASFDAVYDAVGASKALIIQEKPSDPESNLFLTPENNSYYCRLKKWSYDHLAGDKWSLKASVIEER